ncbi:DUF4142 domain-containing protein [Falsirhodobacter sp. 20TX0035]|uniref:DUF4142 domain-containing protein n=1 Tax=Falsirhodobacter sp. 20TX0035 TaxID=3022019 RepID=UPI00232D106C|nr:DUF4142 domain-containing protein [Falsirhodobacter sp. 20TX0035]MDB6454030.1 DUF4142 domain-containing protein [Falsirhodobacter sp. 20TX0035]
MNRRHVFAAGAAVAAALPFASFAQTAAPAAAPADPAKQPALMGGNFALLSSRIAADKATAPAVKTFATLETAEQEAVAMAFGAEPGVGGVSEKHAALLEQLQAAPAGPEFDMMYVDGQIAGHEELRTIHAAYAQNGSDPMARGASMVGVPSIETHLAMLRGIKQSM